MRESERISVEFYDSLGPEGLSARTRAEWNEAILQSLITIVQPGRNILDLGCGYGRIAIPLAQRGYDVRGIDISPTLVEQARRVSEETGVDVEFDIGSMCDLPYEDTSFDVILCLWSAFFELLKHDEQVLALENMKRVLKTDGWALLEGPIYTNATEEEIASGLRYGPDHRIAADLVNGMPRPGFRHDAHSFEKLMTQVDIRRHECYIEKWAGRDRQFLKFWRE